MRSSGSFLHGASIVLYALLKSCFCLGEETIGSIEERSTLLQLRTLWERGALIQEIVFHLRKNCRNDHGGLLLSRDRRRQWSQNVSEIVYDSHLAPLTTAWPHIHVQDKVVSGDDVPNGDVPKKIDREVIDVPIAVRYNVKNHREIDGQIQLF